MKKEYDSILSLGGFCGAASQFRARGLRPCSYPLDWVYMEGVQSVEWLVSAFATGFSGFARRENLVPLEREGVGGLAPFKYKDVKSGYCFIHHFWKPIEDDVGYETFVNTLNRRIKRMMSCFSPGKSVLMVLATPFSFDGSIAERLLFAVRRMFPETEIDLHVMQFNAVFDSPSIESERWPDGSPFSGGRYRRAHGVYDFNRMSAEWAFLDGIALKEHIIPKPRGFTKLCMKLWKRFSKRLRNEGYGVLGVRFNH